ncbi:MAG: GerMN domain-containing protein [Actinomycetales bacterium]|nr:GerMN domain-containing protein [Actinomycetales bacterium]
MTRRSTALRVAAAVLLATIGLSACGVPLDDAARPVDGYLPPTTSASPSGSSPSATGTRVVLWYVDGGSLTSTPSTSPSPVTPGGLLSLLAVTPLRPGWRTLVGDPQGGPPLASVGDPSTVASASPSGDAITVQLSETFAKLAPADQVLLIGQVVLTLTQASTVQIRFVDSTGNAVTVPLPDGRLQDGPVARADFLPLTATRTASPSR